MGEPRPGDLWPIHLKPKDDELLSSWLVRLARAHQLKVHTFCSLIWPGKQIWNRDIDNSADAELLEVLSIRTGTSINRVRATTLGFYAGILYEKHNTLGPSPWIMPIGIYHRTRKQFGLQYCPLCLAEDDEPYFRRKWRLAFIVSCERHRILLHDRCHHCGVAVNFHRTELGNPRKRVADSLTVCHGCCSELKSIENHLTIPVMCVESEFASMLLRAMETGYVCLKESLTIHSLLFFAGLRQLMKIAAMRDSRIEGLRRSISETYDVAAYAPSPSNSQQDVQEMNIEARRQLLETARCLLEEWPDRFIKLSRKYKVWSSLWLRHLEPPARHNILPAPFWLWSVVHDHLYRAKYRPSDEEIYAATRHLKLNGKEVTKSALARLLGVAVIRQSTDNDENR